jgi:hypothetical protein
MKNRILVLLAAVLAALGAALPALAGESGHERFALGEPLFLSGHGRVHGIVEAPELRTVFRARHGALRIVDISGDTKVVCRGDWRTHVRRDEAGHEVIICIGGGAAAVSGGEFRFTLGGKRLQAFFPAGAQGSVAAFGRFVARGGAEDDERVRLRPARPAGATGGLGLDAAVEEGGLDPHAEGSR